jgi:hypothetical protein
MEVEWVYPAEVSVLWRVSLNTVSMNFLFLTCQNFSAFYVTVSLKGRHSPSTFICVLPSSTLSVGRHIALVRRTLQVAQSSSKSTKKMQQYLKFIT